MQMLQSDQITIPAWWQSEHLKQNFHHTCEEDCMLVMDLLEMMIREHKPNGCSGTAMAGGHTWRQTSSQERQPGDAATTTPVTISRIVVLVTEAVKEGDDLFTMISTTQ